MKLYALVGLLAFSVTSQAQNIYFGAKNQSAKKNEFCSYMASVPKLLAAPDASAGVKNFVAALNADSDKILAKMQKDYNAAIADKAMCSEYMYANQQGFSFRVSNQIGATVVSLLSTASGYTGGAHGWAGISAVTFNTVTGEKYTNLGAFFGQSKLEAVKAMILEKIKAERENFDPNFGWNDWSAKHTAIGQIENFYVSEYGLTFYFQQYEVGSYAEGIIESTLNFYDLEQIGFNGSAASLALLSNKTY